MDAGYLFHCRNSMKNSFPAQNYLEFTTTRLFMKIFALAPPESLLNVNVILIFYQLRYS